MTTRVRFDDVLFNDVQSDDVLFHDVLLGATSAERRRRRLTLAATLVSEALVIAALVALPLLYLDALPGVSPRPAAPVALSFAPPVAETAGAVGSGRSIAIARSTDEYVVTRTMADPHLIYNRYRAASDETVAPGTLLPPGCCGTGERVGDGDRIAAIAPRPVMPMPPAHRPVISHVEESVLVHRVDPAYPATARLSHTEGDVVLRAVIGKDGGVESLRVVSGHPLLNAAAVNAVSQWRFRPYQLNGASIEVEAQITVRFVLAAR